MSDFQTIADRVEIEALRAEFTDAAPMRDWDRFASLFTPDGAWRMPYVNVEFLGREEIRAGIERMQGLWDCFLQTAPRHVRACGRHRGRSRPCHRVRAVSRRQLAAASSVYHDRDQRTSDGWKFTERVYQIKYLDTAPLTGAPPDPAPGPTRESSPARS
jgi:SnoaL-like domain